MRALCRQENKGINKNKERINVLFDICFIETRGSMFTFVLSSLIACGLDRHAIRLEEQEKALLYQNAQKHWEGMRWGVPARAAAFYEVRTCIYGRKCFSKKKF